MDAEKRAELRAAAERLNGIEFWDEGIEQEWIARASPTTVLALLTALDAAAATVRDLDTRVLSNGERKAVLAVADKAKERASAAEARVKELEAERDEIEMADAETGCLTGDCPHQKQDQCYGALARLFKGERARTLKAERLHRGLLTRRARVALDEELKQRERAAAAEAREIELDAEAHRLAERLAAAEARVKELEATIATQREAVSVLGRERDGWRENAQAARKSLEVMEQGRDRWREVAEEAQAKSAIDERQSNAMAEDVATYAEALDRLRKVANDAEEGEYAAYAQKATLEKEVARLNATMESIVTDMERARAGAPGGSLVVELSPDTLALMRSEAKTEEARDA